MNTIRRLSVLVLLAALSVAACHRENQVVQRPETVVSMREIVYDKDTYLQLASLWERYNEAYPSEDAYANWMYAARYAGAEDYQALLEAGSRLYPANPTLLYLRSMAHHGKAKDTEALSLLERAAELDPSYTDPWFSLVVHYSERGDEEKMDVALRRILNSGAIAEEVMDYSYNMLASLEPNAILVTNGDNDTYPGWVLTRIVGHRPDVHLVNRSLLNTDWYPLALARDGVPTIVSATSLDSLRTAILEELKASQAPFPPAGPFSDILLDRLFEACMNAGRPLYFAATLFQTDAVQRHLASGRELGIVALVTPPRESDASQMKEVLSTWLSEFRTSGLDGWQLRYAPESRAGKMLVLNYGAALRGQMDRIVRHAPGSRFALFQWYRDHIEGLVPDEKRSEMNGMWCSSTDIREIAEWCRSMNLSK